jgi:putative protein-disulfide isomerase
MRLLYIVDPMCSWCYGFTPALAEVRAELLPEHDIELIAGGLAPDSDEPMPPATRAYVQAAWQAVTERTGVRFNHDFWTTCQPRRSTYPACRALILARKAGLGWEMLAAIQRAYYQEARNPSDATTLTELATEIGLEPEVFATELTGRRVETELRRDLTRRAALGATSFPNLGLADDTSEKLVASGCLSAADLRGRLSPFGLLQTD